MAQFSVEIICSPASLTRRRGGLFHERGVAGLPRAGPRAARAAGIVSSRPLATQLSLFNIFHEMFDDQQVRDTLHSLPDPLPDTLRDLLRCRMASLTLGDL